jgi:hydroxyacylglutathione hydrolase
MAKNPGAGAAELATLTLGPLETNCYLLADRTQGCAAVIDPGDETWRIQHELAMREWTPVWVLITHAHFDHIAAGGDLAKAFGCPVALHPADLPLWWMQGGANLFGLDIPPQPKPDHSLQDGEKIAVGSLELEVLHLPGHSPGHVGFYLKSEGWLFSGDVIFAGGGMGRVDLLGGNGDTLKQSILKRVARLPDSTIIYPGHGEKTTILAEKGYWAEG